MASANRGDRPDESPSRTERDREDGSDTVDDAVRVIDERVGAGGQRPAARPAGARRAWRLDLIAAALAALVLFPLLSKSGIWDPYELDAAELSRRIAIHAFGAQRLELPGAANGMPTLTDLKMGELGLTSIALGFRWLGLRDWAGRLPLAIWAFSGAMVLYALVARLLDRKAGLYATIVLVTMPLYVMQARTMLGDIVTMAALCIAFCGLTGALLDGGRRAGAGALIPRLLWLAAAAVGLAAGYMSRGLLIGVAIPALGAGLTWALLRVSGGPGAALGPRLRLGFAAGDVVGVLALAVGIAAAAKGFHLLLTTTAADPLPRALGVALLKKPPVESTFDLAVRQLGHALFPWSAFLPFAIGRLLRAPADAPGAAEPRPALDREAGLRVALLVTAAVAFGVFTLLAPHAGALPFSGPALLAAIAALAIRDFERGAPSSRALALGCALLSFVLYRDLVLQPEKALAVFSVDKPVFPKSFEPEAADAMRFVFVAFAGLVALSWFEEQPRAPQPGLAAWARGRLAAYRAAIEEITRAWSGNLVFALIVIEAALIGLGAMIFVGKRLGWVAVAKMPNQVAEYGVNAWWALPLLLALGPLALVAVRDGYRFAVHQARLPRAAGTLLAGLVAGFALSFWYYPALAAQLSPKEVFASYAALRSPGEPLALLGVRSRGAVYYQGGEVESLPDVTRAFQWLGQPGASDDGAPPRRWLVVKADDLPKLNSLYRKQTKRNLPVLDGRSSQILLASNQLGGRENQSWIAKMVLDEPPPVARPVEAMFEDRLEVIGWEVTDAEGKVVSSVVPQTPYHLRTFFRVHGPITGNWKMFIHIDGFQRRYNGDHPVLDGRYPMSLWQPGDVVVDDHAFQLEPNFTPGDYTYYFGFFSGDNRFRVASGPHQEDRVVGGPLRVR